jgi:hypothetical protein
LEQLVPWRIGAKDPLPGDPHDQAGDPGRGEPAHAHLAEPVELAESIEHAPGHGGEAEDMSRDGEPGEQLGVLLGLAPLPRLLEQPADHGDEPDDEPGRHADHQD